MTAPAWPELEALFPDALARGPAERAPFLAERCAGRSDLQAQVEAMLRAHEEAARASGGSSIAAHPAVLRCRRRDGQPPHRRKTEAQAHGDLTRPQPISVQHDVLPPSVPRVQVATRGGDVAPALCSARGIGQSSRE